MKEWRPVDYIVVLLTISMCIILVTIVFGPLIASNITPMSESKAKLFSGLLTTVITIISIYVGSVIQRNLDKDK